MEDSDNEDKGIVIEVDKEFIDILNELEEKIKKITWDGIEKIGKKNLTKILAKKIRAKNIV